MRQVRIDRERDPRPGVAMTSFALEYAADSRVAAHAHGSDQLMFATRGLMEVSTASRYWLIPPQFAVWMPARTAHRIRMASAVSMRTLCFRHGIARGLPTTCTVLSVNPLLRALIVEAVRLGTLRLGTRLHAALRILLVAQLHAARAIPTLVTLPQDPRALRVAETFIADPKTTIGVADLCRRCGVTPRTTQRLFLRETGMSFEVWRRQVRLLKGIELLMAGQWSRPSRSRSAISNRIASSGCSATRSARSLGPGSPHSTPSNQRALEIQLATGRCRVGETAAGTPARALSDLRHVLTYWISCATCREVSDCGTWAMSFAYRLQPGSRSVSWIGFYSEVLPQQAALSAALAEGMKGTPLYQAYAATAPDPSEFPRLLDAMGTYMRRPYDWSADATSLREPVMLVYGDGDIIRPEHMIEFYHLLGGGLRDAGWMREHMPPNRLAIIPDVTHYAIFADPRLADTVLRFLDRD